MSSNSHDAVHCPPQKLSDLIVHYDEVSFHVHRFVLLHHSKQFESMIDALSHDSDKQSEQPHKRQRTCTCQ